MIVVGGILVAAIGILLAALPKDWLEERFAVGARCWRRARRAPARRRPGGRRRRADRSRAQVARRRDVRQDPAHLGYRFRVARSDSATVGVRTVAAVGSDGAAVGRTALPSSPTSLPSRRWQRLRRPRWRSASARCGSRTPTGCTSRRPARRSSTSSTTTSPSGRASSTRCASGRACCTASRPGVSGEKVHQKRVPAGAPPWLETVRVHFPRYGLHADELCVTELAEVIWAVQMSTVEFHPWNSRRADVEKPDEWRIDLDPMPDCPLRHGAAGRPRRPRGARRARRRRAGRRRRAARACTSTSASSRRTGSATSAAPRSRSPARSSAARPTT